MKDDVPSAVIDFVRRFALVPNDSAVSFEPLSGGVSSEIFLARAGSATVCIKRALPKLKVSADWHAPIERCTSEARWLQTVYELRPGYCPRLLAHDDIEEILGLEYLPSESYVVWKREILDGRVDVGTAVNVGRRLAEIHSDTAARTYLKAQFDTEEFFVSLRIRPFLFSLVPRYPELKDRLEYLARTTLTTRVALVHGDVSPKNILLGPVGPVLLDAECAWWGDPAFDLAFCVNHLLLKCLVVSDRSAELLRGAIALVDAYLDGVTWEDPALLEVRVAALLPALLLARVDGWSPVEYLDEKKATKVRVIAAPLVVQSPRTVRDIVGHWEAAL